jgi:hypothetical protein
MVSTPAEDRALGSTKRLVLGDGSAAHLETPEVQSISNVRSPAEENARADVAVSRLAATRTRDDALGIALNRRSSVSKQEFR